MSLTKIWWGSAILQRSDEVLYYLKWVESCKYSNVRLLQGEWWQFALAKICCTCSKSWASRSVHLHPTCRTLEWVKRDSGLYIQPLWSLGGCRFSSIKTNRIHARWKHETCRGLFLYFLRDVKKNRQWFDLKPLLMLKRLQYNSWSSFDLLQCVCGCPQHTIYSSGIVDDQSISELIRAI